MKKRVLSLALCLVLVVGLFSGLTVNASASKIDDLRDWKKKGCREDHQREDQAAQGGV